jgi:hypothetical protein
MGDDRRHEARHGSVSSDEGDGTPHCWNPEWLLRQPASSRTAWSCSRATKHLRTDGAAREWS